MVEALDTSEPRVLPELPSESEFMTDEGVDTEMGAGWANDAANLFAEM